MVTSITSLSRSGLLDWLMQRVSAVVLAAYTVFLFGFFVTTSEVTFEVWQALFANFWVKIFTLATLLSLVGHIWVGMWTIATDYVKNAWTRFLVISVIALTNFIYFVVGFSAVWGV
ncbi:succinate dehydrogenase, hydrophobic membrane anchor protein [Reinekea marina]|uniref:Succinate dehydrogenase hydrophobic membrane anchor subunit n=1 Tax=Reinekea marina TaxID=1310421 RepID=A0ABV7WPT6_9GAMM|nr:succinate dehydrogenase, hydrophobic membrane anchor protein [Reinekea marina]MBU2863199.1 succinate dehydrogenase, hydrophobic membrane anchor protein [Reinekea forsetii]MDN3649403.1 succinate dehydrogenase, hydrophobic membrane anchor protein [Reinekea marina]